ncbi:MAG: hypothetical protein COB02_12830 [Candidatus Cloacimonadota bacterium]|nr:MAG: hypothetical protein COB02_12830 [Candidatus Cloacimonadota bacterium]
MGMAASLTSISDDNIDIILANPPLIWRIIAPDDPETYFDAVDLNSKQGFFLKIFSKKNKKAKELPNINFLENENKEIDLDKAWDGLNFCLNQNSSSFDSLLTFIIQGGEDIGDIDIGYGPGRFFRDKTTKDIALLLNEWDENKLRESYNPKKMEELDIYPNIWMTDNEEAFEYILDHFKVLKAFINECVKDNLGILIFLC